MHVVLVIVLSTAYEESLSSGQLGRLAPCSPMIMLE